MKYSKRATFTFLTLLNIVLWGVSLAIYFYKGIAFLDSVFPLVVSVPAFLSFLFISRNKGFKLVFSFLTVCNFGMLKSYIGILAFQVSGQLFIRIVFESISFLFILLILILGFRKQYFIILETLEEGWIYLCSVPFLLTILIYQLLYMYNSSLHTPKGIGIIFIVFTLMISFYIVSYVIFKNISHFFHLKQSRELLQLQVDAQKNTYSVMLEKINTVQIYRHDMKHHLNVLHSLISDSNTTEAKKYLSKLDQNINGTIVAKFCNNYVLNIILSTYINKAKQDQIIVDSHIEIPETILIDEIELGLIFTNALDNAIYACTKINNPADRIIKIKCLRKQDQLFIQISNPFSGNIVFENGIPVSNHENHGFGTRSIVSIIEKYNGTYSFSSKNCIFQLAAIIKFE
jgi:signal transduction histidine kinase